MLTMIAYRCSFIYLSYMLMLYVELKLKYENLLKLDLKKIYNTLSSGPLAQSTVG